MSTEMRDANGVALTQQEAEAVIELWAKKQAETESLRSRLTVEDMAEAMSIPPSEVEQMLSAVRMQKAVPPEPVLRSQVRPVNKPLIAAASILWVVILVSACVTAYGMGRRDRATELLAPTPMAEIPYDPGMPVHVQDMAIIPPPPETAAAPVMDTGVAVGGYEISQMGRFFERGVTVTFASATVKGLVSPQGRTTVTSGPLIQLVSAALPTPSITTDSELTDLELVKALRSGTATKDGSVVFLPCTMKLPGGELISQSIPVANTQNDRVVRLVSEEQQRRTNILASMAEEKLAP